MSVVSDIYDAIVTKVAATATGYVRVPFPYGITENTALLIKKGFGVAIDEGTNTLRYVGCLSTWERSFRIELIKQVVNTENDTLGKASVEKELMEVARSIFLAFEADPTLGGICIKAIVRGDLGVQYEEGQTSKFLACEIGLAVEYQESTI